MIFAGLRCQAAIGNVHQVELVRDSVHIHKTLSEKDVLWKNKCGPQNIC